MKHGDMADPYNLRLNDSKNPERAKTFDICLEVGHAESPAVIRSLVDAFIAYVQEHKRVPSFPVRLVSADEDAKLQEQSPLYQAGAGRK